MHSQSIITQVRRNDSEDDSESIHQDEKDYEERYVVNLKVHEVVA